MVELESLFVPQSPELCAHHHPARWVAILSPGAAAGSGNHRAACRLLHPAPLEGVGMKMGAGYPPPTPAPVCLTSQACISGVVCLLGGTPLFEPLVGSAALGCCLQPGQDAPRPRLEDLQCRQAATNVGAGQWCLTLLGMDTAGWVRSWITCLFFY